MIDFDPLDLDEVRWGRDGLVPAIIQDVSSGSILMLGWMNRESLTRTLESGQVWFYSRSRKALWRKGETSGNTLAVTEVRLDCDRDAILVRARPAGPVCHEGWPSCFYHPIGAEEDGGPLGHTVEDLIAVLGERRAADPETSYTARLLADGVEAVGAKIVEEAGEMVVAMERESDDRVASEAADLIYHLLVGLLARRVMPERVWKKLEERAGTSGLVEKATRH